MANINMIDVVGSRVANEKKASGVILSGGGCGCNGGK